MRSSGKSFVSDRHSADAATDAATESAHCRLKLASASDESGKVVRFSDCQRRNANANATETLANPATINQRRDVDRERERDGATRSARTAASAT
jgi:hypothetical protein